MLTSGHFHVLSIWKPHFQCNANWKVPTTSPRFCSEPHQLHVFFVKVAPGTPSHPGQNATLLWLERPSSKCTKLPTVATSNNKYPTSCSSYFCLFAPPGCCSSCTSHAWWIAHSTQCYLSGHNTCSKFRLDFLKWLRVKETSKMQSQ